MSGGTVKEFKTGIYRGKDRRLYFAPQTRKEAVSEEAYQSAETYVCFDAMFPSVTEGLVKKLGPFLDEFALVKELPPEKSRILLPGSRVVRGDGKEVFTVLNASETKDILIDLASKETALTIKTLEEFLKEFREA